MSVQDKLWKERCSKGQDLYDREECYNYGTLMDAFLEEAFSLFYSPH